MVRKTRSKDSWESAFPASQDIESDRLRFMARMGYIAIAHYLLYRKLIPLGVYKRRRITDTVIYCFDTSKRWGEKLSQMMHGLKEAIENKYLESALVVINGEGGVASEVFIVRFCYERGHAINIVDEGGNQLVYFEYKDEETFRKQTKHIIKKINAVTKKLQPLKDGILPELKLTYMPGVPDEYEPPFFTRGEGTYIFAKKPILYNYGSITSNSTAIAFHLKSIYLNNNIINELEDALYDEVGLVDKQFVDPKDVSGEFFTDEEESPLHVPQSPAQVEVPRSEEVFVHHSILDSKSSLSIRNIMKSPEDQLSYEG